jgi:hypothetical protein
MEGDYAHCPTNVIECNGDLSTVIVLQRDQAQIDKGLQFHGVTARRRLDSLFRYGVVS